MKSSYGYFDKGGREFVVTEYKTRLPLINYYWNNQFISGANQCCTGQGTFFARTIQYMHPETRCLLTRDENRHFYLRDHDSGEIWSPGWYPVCEELDEYECRHGMGYTILESCKSEIESRLRVFVPLELPAEIWTVTLKNRSEKKKRSS